MNLKKKNPEIHDQIFCLADDMSELEMIALLLEKKFKAVINKKNLNFQRDLDRAKLIEANKLAFFKNPEHFIFQTNARYKTITIRNSVDKVQAREEISAYSELLHSSFLEDSINSIFEELFMNAIYDAPREAEPSNQSVFIHPVELIIGDDSENLVISCLDYYGSLNPEKFLNRLFQVLKHGAGKVMNMDESKGGAGIGSRILFDCSSNIIVAVTPKNYTRVTCIIPLNTSRKKFSNIIKNIQLVVG